MRNPNDNRVHWSELREFSHSAAHYKYACEVPRETTRAMTVGAAFDAMVLGGKKVALYPGKVRNGKEWDGFRERFADHVIVIQSEHDEARAMATAILASPVAAPFLVGERQRVIHWDYCDVPCAAGLAGVRGGFDVLGDDFINDVKSVPSADPSELSRHAWKRLYHAQLAFYRSASTAIGRQIKHCYLTCVEQHPPHCVTVLELTDRVLAEGDKSVRLWIERYKACEEANVWPGYVQCPVPMDVPEWYGDTELGDE